MPYELLIDDNFSFDFYDEKISRTFWKVALEAPFSPGRASRTRKHSLNERPSQLLQPALACPQLYGESR